MPPPQTVPPCSRPRRPSGRSRSEWTPCSASVWPWPLWPSPWCCGKTNRLWRDRLFLVGVGNSFFDPAAQAAIPGVVGRDPAALARTNGKLWAIDTFGRGLAGPPLGALAFAAAAALPFGAQGVAFLCSALLLLRLAEP